MRIYTKSGDKGETGLIGGKRVSKSDLRIAALGDVDELNAVIGVLRNYTKSKKILSILRQAQDDIIAIGTELADPEGKIRLKKVNVNFLEQEIDKLEAKLPPLKKFIIPGGNLFSSYCHLARTVCRRAERAVVALGHNDIIPYLNRLSDLLFMLSRT